MIKNTHSGGATRICTMLSLPQETLAKHRKGLEECLWRLDLDTLTCVREVRLVVEKMVAAKLDDKKTIDKYFKRALELTEEKELLGGVGEMLEFVDLIQLIHESKPEVLLSELKAKDAHCKFAFDRVVAALKDFDVPLIYLVRLATIYNPYMKQPQYLLLKISHNKEKLFRISQDAVKALMQVLANRINVANNKDGLDKVCDKNVRTFVQYVLWEYMRAPELSSQAAANLVLWLKDRRFFQFFDMGDKDTLLAVREHVRKLSLKVNMADLGWVPK